MTEKRELPEGFDWRAITPDDSAKTPMDVMSDPVHIDLATANLEQGQMAYNIVSKLYDYSDGTERTTDTMFDLLEVAKEKPVALIFGSYT